MHFRSIVQHHCVLVSSIEIDQSATVPLWACDTAKLDRKGFRAKSPKVVMLSGVIRRSSAIFLTTICSCENARKISPVRPVDGSALGRVAMGKAIDHYLAMASFIMEKTSVSYWSTWCIATR